MHLSSMHRPPSSGLPARLIRILSAFAPAPLRASLETDGVETLRAVCADAHGRRGTLGYFATLTIQAANIAAVVVSARFGGRAALSHGQRRS
jgi:hypothetical protein